MPDALARLNALPQDRAVAELLHCCGSGRWAVRLAEQRPFRDAAHLLAAADDTWGALPPVDWLQAFHAHPRIGERHAATEHGTAAAPGTATALRWSEQEQAGMAAAESHTARELAHLQHEYEQKFGYIFIICATGRTAQEMLDELRARLHNEPTTELRVAAAEQRRITRLRLEKLLNA